MNTSTIRRLPPYVLGSRLRARGVFQWDIAKELGCSQTYVSRVINRRAGRTAKTEAVWQYIEAILLGDGRAA